MSVQIVTYQVDDSTNVRFEIESAEGFRPAGPGQVLSRVRDAVSPAVEAARAVMEKVREIEPHGMEVKFGVKASGGVDWLVAKAVGEASFEITLTWGHQDSRSCGATSGASGPELARIAEDAGAGEG